MNKPLKGFITYSHKNTEAKDELITCLAVMKQQNELITWHDNEMLPSDKWREEIFSTRLPDSDLLLYLVSAASLASENCNKELGIALKKNVKPIPIILEDCDWKKHQLGDFQALPDRGNPINEWHPESKGWQNVVDGIRKIVDVMQSQTGPSSDVSEKELRAELAFQQGSVFIMLGQMNKAIEAYSRAIEHYPNNPSTYHNRGVAYYIKGDYDRVIIDYTKVIELKSDDAESYYNRGKVYREKGDINLAIADFNTVIHLESAYIEAYIDRGIAYYDKGEYDIAIEDYTKAIDLNPNHANAHNNRGNAYISKDEYDLAIKNFDKAVALEPNNTMFYNNRGGAYGKKGDFDRAIKDFNKSIELNADFVSPYYNRGTIYSDRGEISLAIADFNTVIQLDPNNAIAYYDRGNAYTRKHDNDRAIEDYTKAIELNPNYADAYFIRGATYNIKGDYDHAIKDFTKVIELKSDNADAYNNRGMAYHKQDKIDCAIADYTKAIDLNSSYANAYSNRGGAYGKKGNFDLAIKDFNKSIQLNARDASVYYNRGITYGKKNEINRAIADYTKAIDLNPNYTEAYYSRGNAYREKGDYDRAIKDFTKTVELNPNYVEAYTNRGGAYSFKGEADKAIIDCSKAIELSPNDAGAYNNRGVAYKDKGDFDRSIADYTKAMELNPNYADAYSNRGVVHSITGDFDRAIADYTKAVDLNPNYAIAYYNRGNAYGITGDFDRAVEDYTKTIELDRKFAPAYYYRGEVWLQMEEWERAESDLIIARDMGIDIIAAFHNTYESVEAYQRANRVKLPEDIATMLIQPRRSRFPKTEKFMSSDGKPTILPNVLNLRTKLSSVGTHLSQYIQTLPTFGLKTGRSEAFIVDGATREQLIAEHPASAEILKPFLHGRDIRRWQVARPDSWLIFAYRRIEIGRYPAIRKHLEKYRSALSKRAGKGKWYELPTAGRNAEHFTQTKLICPNSYDHQTFAVDTEGFYCGDTCYLIPTEETWLCGLLNSHAVEWFYSQTSKQLTGDYLQARSRYIQEIPIPDLTSAQKSLIGKIVHYLIFLQGQPTTSGKDLAHARDFIMLGYFERIIDGLVYESYLGEELHQGEKQFFKPLLDERLPQIEEIRGDKMFALQEIFERLYERTHPIRRNLFFLDSVKPIRIIEGKA